MPLSDADYAKLLRLNCDHWALRLEFCFLKTELARRGGFNPNQPRAPRGNPDGGQWTDGSGSGGSSATPGQAQLISSRPRSGGTVRIGGRWVEATPAQQARLAVSDARARDAVRRVREIEPNWRPRPSLSEGVEGAILTNESTIREAEGRLAELGRQATPEYLGEIITSGGQSLGIPGARSNIRNVTSSEFNSLLPRLVVGTRPAKTPPGVSGQWYLRSDGTIFAARVSKRHGLTIDIIKSNDPTLPRGFKIHQHD